MSHLHRGLSTFTVRLESPSLLCSFHHRSLVNPRLHERQLDVWNLFRLVSPVLISILLPHIFSSTEFQNTLQIALMPRDRDRGFLDAIKLWSLRPPNSRIAPIACLTIARTFEQIDQAMLDEMQDDMLQCAQPSDDPTQWPASVSRFKSAST